MKNTALYRLLLCKDQKNVCRGVTIIESVVSVLVLSIGLLGLLPLVAISVATRVQSQRIELAANASRTYLDGLRSETVSPPSLATARSLGAVPAPTSGSLNCAANSYCLAPTASNSSFYCVDGDLDGVCSNASDRDMLVQSFVINSAPGASPLAGYSLGIRVYRASAFQNNQVFLASFSGSTVQQTFGFSNSSTGESPLYELTTDVSPSAATYDNLCSRVDASTGSIGCQ